MSNSGVLQIRADSSLIAQAQKNASEIGFSSVQEMIRVILKQIVNKQISLAFSSTVAKEKFSDEYIELGPKAKKRWDRILRDADNDKNMYSFDDPDKALKFLLSKHR